MDLKRSARIVADSLDYARNELARFTRDAFHDQKALLASTKVQTIFDIGANVGKATAKYSTLFPEASIYCFEPFSESFQELHRRFQGKNLIMPVQAAISNKCGKQRFYVNRDSTTNSLLPIAEKVNRWVKPDAIRNISEIDVSVTTIDDFCIEKSIDRIDILKLDIQGGELMALEGAKRKLTDGSILLVYTEMLFVPIYKEEALFTDICSALAAHNYMLFNMYRFHHAKTGQLKWGDALFVSPRLTH